MFNKILDFFRNTNNNDLNAQMILMKKKTETDFIYDITNGRKGGMKNEQKIMKGYGFINSFIQRGITLQSKS